MNVLLPMSPDCTFIARVSLTKKHWQQVATPPDTGMTKLAVTKLQNHAESKMNRRSKDQLLERFILTVIFGEIISKRAVYAELLI